MIQKTEFNKKELKVIQKIIQIQIDSLRAISRNECEDDVDLFALRSGIDPKKFKQLNQVDLEMYEGLKNNPENFMSLSPIQMGIIRHILVNFMTNQKYTEAKMKIWRKINLLEYYFDHNLN